MSDSLPIQTEPAANRLALESVLQQHQDAIHSYLRSRLARPEDAEDLTQEVFLRWHLGKDRFNPAQKVRPWLIGIARNVLSEHLKKVGKRKEVAWTEMCLRLEELVDFKEEAGCFDDVLPLLTDCLNALGQSARQALAFRYHGDMSLAQIGVKLRRSESAVKFMMFRARQALKYCLTSKRKGGAHD